EKAEAAVYMSGGTIVAGFGHGIWTNGINSQIYLSGGVINVTGDGGRGIFTEGAHSLINMKGGLVSAWGDSGNAICDFGTNTIIEISDGFVFNCAKAITGEYDVIRMLVGEPQIAGSSVVIAWNRSAGNTVYADGTSDDLVLAPAGASAFWTTGGIKYANGLNTGTFAIDGISIASDEPEPTPAQPPDEPPPPPTASMENFVTASTNTYVPGTFEDVDNAWYEQNVAIVYECGLMLGYGNGFFGAQNTITVVEVITVAARVHSIYLSGFVVPMTSSLPPETAPWYAGIMEYAIANGIVKADDFSEADYGRAATRAEMAYVFSKTLPPEEFPAQNIVNSIPDVPNTLKYAKEIHTMYKAGIISGVDEAGTFLPNNNITRAEAAAIISRVIFPDQRGAGHTFG
ncbi:MAG: S-layer homology domain-containing protein, partial [Oscillospiraceae bacterium]|nr:S-layer homology domain-containing protein [Oscillospiraceae bacterium]